MPKIPPIIPKSKKPSHRNSVRADSSQNNENSRSEGIGNVGLALILLGVFFLLILLLILVALVAYLATRSGGNEPKTNTGSSQSQTSGEEKSGDDKSKSDEYQPGDAGKGNEEQKDGQKEGAKGDGAKGDGAKGDGAKGDGDKDGSARGNGADTTGTKEAAGNGRGAKGGGNSGDGKGSGTKEGEAEGGGSKNDHSSLGKDGKGEVFGDDESRNETDGGKTDLPEGSRKNPKMDDSSLLEIPSSTIFEISAEGRRVVYLIDCSEHIQGKTFRRIKSELIKSVEAFEEHQLFVVAFYSESVHPFDKKFKMIPASDNNKLAVIEWIKEFEPTGDSPTQPPIQNIFDEAGPDVVYLLSSSKMEPSFVSSIKKANSSRAKINTVGFQGSDSVLKKIADTNSGIYRSVN